MGTSENVVAEIFGQHPSSQASATTKIAVASSLICKTRLSRRERAPKYSKYSSRNFAQPQLPYGQVGKSHDHLCLPDFSSAQRRKMSAWPARRLALISRPPLFTVNRIMPPMGMHTARELGMEIARRLQRNCRALGTSPFD